MGDGRWEMGEREGVWWRWQWRCIYLGGDAGIEKFSNWIPCASGGGGGGGLRSACSVDVCGYDVGDVTDGLVPDIAV